MASRSSSGSGEAGRFGLDLGVGSDFGDRDGCENWALGLEYPAAALVFDTTPWSPVNEVCFLDGLATRPCNVVPTHGSSSSSWISSSNSSSLSGGLLASAVPRICSTAAFLFEAFDCASLRFSVSGRITVVPSTGREMVLMLDALRVLARAFRRSYSRWWMCCVKSLAMDWNSSSTIMYRSSWSNPSCMNLITVEP